ncbi:alanine-zipper protein [Priestia megaterium]
MIRVTSETSRSLANNAQSSANSAQSTANTASSKADSAQSTADTANSTANYAKSTVDGGKSKWEGAYNLTQTWRKGNTTEIDGGNISTQSIQAKSMVMADFTNLCENPDFEGDAPGANPMGFNSQGNFRVVDISQYSYTNGSNRALWIDASSTGNSDAYVSNLIPVSKGQQFYVGAEGRYYNTNGTGYGRIGFRRYDSKKQAINAWDSVAWWTGSKNQNFNYQSGTYTVPDGCSYLQLWISFANNGTTNNSFIIDNIRVHRMANAELIVDGIIEGRHIKADSITFDKAKGGTLKLGGTGNENGVLEVYSSEGELIANLDGDKGGFTSLYVADFDSPSVVEYGDANLNFYVSDRWLDYSGAVDPSDENSGNGWAQPLATIGEALRRIPKFNDGAVTINLPYSGVFYENIDILGYLGTGSITISGGNGVRINGNIRAYKTLNNIYFKNFTLNGTAGSYGNIQLAQSPYISVENVYVYGNNSQRAFDVRENAYAQISNCEVYDVDYGICSRYGATTYVYNCKGLGAVCGLYAYGGYIVGKGTAPAGTKYSNAQSGDGGTVNSTFTYNTGAAAPPPVPETTKSFSSSSGNSWRDNFSGQWYNQGIVAQGYWGGYGVYRGLWFFGTSLSDTVKGKTIKSMRMYVKRTTSGGNSGSITCYFRSHNYTGQPSGTPSLGGSYTTATFKWGEGKWINIPSSMWSDFTSGTAKGIGVYINSTSQNYYARFGTSATIEVTYK